jgi:two-component system sensor histidine kinase VanS
MATYGFLVLATPISYNSIMEDLESKRAFMLASELSRVTIEESGAIIDRFQTDHSVEVSIFDVEGNTVVIKMPEQPVKDDIYITTSGNTVDNSNVSASIGVSTQFSFQGSDNVYKIVTMSMITPVNHTVEAMRDVLPILIVMILLISFLGASFYSHYITRPIVRLSILSQKMTGLDFSCHSNETRTDEIGVLGRNLDGLSCNLSTSIERLSVVNDKLQKDIDAERELEKQRTEFFTAVSHELKTPLTILSGQLSGMLEGVGIYQDHEKYLPRSLSVVRRMEKLVGELLVISRLEQSSGKESNEIILLSELLEEQIENISELAVLKSQEMETFIAPHVQISGDKDLIQKAVSNLLCNAVICSPEKAKITVLLEEKRLIIKNTGVQIPQEALSHLFEPLYRVDSSRNSKTGGSGLGLYLVKMVLDRHGAVCMINNTANGVEAIVEFLT